MDLVACLLVCHPTFQLLTCYIRMKRTCYLPFFAGRTFLRFGLAFFAAGLALRVDEARIAPAAFIDTSDFLAIDFCAAAKPMPFFAAAIYLPFFFAARMLSTRFGYGLPALAALALAELF